VTLLLYRMLDYHRAAVRDVPIVDRPWPDSAGACRIDLAPQVRRQLRSAGVEDERELLSATYGDLLALPGMGPRSVYEVAVAAEAAIVRAYGGTEGGEPPVDLTRAKGAPWAAFVTAEDPRFRDLFPGGSGSLTQWLDAAEHESADGEEARRALATVLPTVLERVAAIDATPLDVAMRMYVEALSGLGGGVLDAILLRYGFDGGPPRSLPRALNGAHVGTERLRQLQVRMLARAPAHQVYMPALDRALELLSAAAPMPVADAESSLQRSGIATIPYHPASVIAAARLCRRAPDLEIAAGRDGPIVINRSLRAGAQALVRLATQRASTFGAVSLEHLVEAAAASGVRLSPREARAAITCFCSVEFLDDDWFWFPARRQNRLCTLSRRILSVAAPVDLATMRAGVCRAYGRRRASLVPPESALEAFFASHPGFVLDRRRRIRPRTPIDYRQQLGKNDRIFVDVFAASGERILERRWLREACLARGMTPHTFDFETKVSVILDNPSTGVWRLRGTSLRALPNDAVFVNRTAVSYATSH
jgi:hypothetical protein